MNPGAYHYHANINCTDAGAATGANDSDECVLIGDLDLEIAMKFSLLPGYYRDGVPVYGLCKDSDGMVRLVEHQQHIHNQLQSPYSTGDDILL